MNWRLSNPRSTLHALPPIGTGTSQVESLLSYLCRLAVSHSISLSSFSRSIATMAGYEFSEKYDWHLASINGIGEAAHTWTAALSALTGVPQLDRLALLPWRGVIAQTGLAATSSRWCPACLREDLKATGVPYFRLAWDIGAVSACVRHRVKLINACPGCGRANTRHKSAYVIPGWCTHVRCGAFLGDVEKQASPAPGELWKADQVAAMMAAQQTLGPLPTRDVLHDAIRTLITRLDHGKSAVFARRIGLSKTTVHHWLKEGGLPTLTAHLHIASQTGLALPRLLTGDLTGWSRDSVELGQLALLFPDRGKRATPRTHDWIRIRQDLSNMAHTPQIVSVLEAARQLDIDPRLLYQNANTETRVLAERWRQHMRDRSEHHREIATQAIETACHAIVSDGKGINLREVTQRISPEILGGVRKVIGLMQEAKGSLG
ncbi:TniQ family protein [Paraburkholderia sp.]|uniref:TniQ family protein n=1 Tax=Paraburkholderia sp. TaxID=1926495 RepID=UPI0025D8AF67|nr:TniQ family protein [Paraburkholderia sp.]